MALLETSTLKDNQFFCNYLQDIIKFDHFWVISGLQINQHKICNSRMNFQPFPEYSHITQNDNTQNITQNDITHNISQNDIKYQCGLNVLELVKNFHIIHQRYCICFDQTCIWYVEIPVTAKGINREHDFSKKRSLNMILFKTKIHYKYSELNMTLSYPRYLRVKKLSDLIQTISTEFSDFYQDMY